MKRRLFTIFFSLAFFKCGSAIPHFRFDGNHGGVGFSHFIELNDDGIILGTTEHYPARYSNWDEFDRKWEVWLNSRQRDFSFAGFRLQAYADYGGSSSGGNLRLIDRGNVRWLTIPNWSLVFVLAFPVLIWLPKIWRRRERNGHCRRCGYDLRATLDRCPECGTETKNNFLTTGS